MQKYNQNESCQAGVLTLFEQLDLTQLERAFSRTDLGQLYQAIPFKTLAAKIPQPKGKRSGLCRKAWMSVEGGIPIKSFFDNINYEPQKQTWKEIYYDNALKLLKN